MKKNNDSLLFITRNYPPVVGGLENYSFNLSEQYRKLVKDYYLIANKKGKKYLPAFYLKTIFTAIKLIRKNNIKTVHVADGLLTPLGFIVKKFTKAEVFCTLHGLDVTSTIPLYQTIIPKFINRMDKVICISKFTKDEAVKRKIDKKKIIVINNAVNSEDYIIPKKIEIVKKELSKKINHTIEDKIVISTIGRLVERKGVLWFAKNVLPKLGKNYVYLVAGDGTLRQEIEKISDEKLIYLGRVDDKIRNLIYNGSDYFVMPNITIGKDTEGFGLVALEASCTGTTVVASRLQGIKDAVKEGKNGWLVEEKNVKQYVQKLKKKIQRTEVKKYVENKYSWQKTAKEYLEAY